MGMAVGLSLPVKGFNTWRQVIVLHGLQEC